MSDANRLVGWIVFEEKPIGRVIAQTQRDALVEARRRFGARASRAQREGRAMGEAAVAPLPVRVVRRVVRG